MFTAVSTLQLAFRAPRDRSWDCIKLNACVASGKGYWPVVNYLRIPIAGAWKGQEVQFAGRDGPGTPRSIRPRLVWSPWVGIRIAKELPVRFKRGFRRDPCAGYVALLRQPASYEESCVLERSFTGCCYRVLGRHVGLGGEGSLATRFSPTDGCQTWSLDVGRITNHPRTP